MAIYHLTATVISRARGQSVTAAAAYRSASVLRDEWYGLTHNYSRQRTVAHTEIMSPAGAPEWAHDRETLWNRVEASERRKDSQLARALDISLPVELSDTQNVALLREYVAQEFVSQGMIADFSIRRNSAGNPHAHILLTLRAASASGFGPKARHWNRKSNLVEWRAAWAERANQHLARAGHLVRIDHRTLDAQQSELTPARNLGVPVKNPRHAMAAHLKERHAEQRRIAQENGAKIIEDPTVALRALTRQQAAFTQSDLIRFLQSRTGDAAQLDAALAAVLRSSELVRADDAGRLTSQDMLEAQKSLMKRVAAMSTRRGHGAALSAAPGARRSALQYTVGAGDIKALAARSDLDKGALLAAARACWELHGLRVAAVALSTRGAQSLQAATGIPTQTLAAQEQEWQARQEGPAPNDVLIVDGAEMIGLKQLERLVAATDKARAKIVLIGDARQLEAMQGTSPLQSIIDNAGLIIEDTLPDM